MMRKYRVLSMDGTSVSGGSGFVAMSLLQTLQGMCREATGNPKTSLLGQVDVLAGTSAGSLNAALLARYDDPAEAIDRGLEFWYGFLDTMRATGAPVTREITALLGMSALTSMVGIRDYCIEQFGRNLKLGDLKRRVVIPAFQLDSAPGASRRAWQPKIFDNFGPDADKDELVVDVVLRSGSPPLLAPIYQGLNGVGPGFVDGGVFANNPSLVALAEVLQEMATGDWKGGRQEDILLWSVGNGDAPAYLAPDMEDGFADWGYGRWLLNPHDPGAIIYTMMESGVLMTDYQCQHILRDRYHRLDPALTESLRPWGGDQMTDALQAVHDLPGTKQDVRDTMTWLRQSGWLDGDAAAAGSEPVK
jgi:patatin-like phospholipase/acyl hydrolase